MTHLQNLLVATQSCCKEGGRPNSSDKESKQKCGTAVEKKTNENIWFKKTIDATANINSSIS